MFYCDKCEDIDCCERTDLPNEPVLCDKCYMEIKSYNKAIQDFYDKVLNFEDYIEPLDVSPLGTVLLYSPYDIKKMIVKIKEELIK